MSGVACARYIPIPMCADDRADGAALKAHAQTQAQADLSGGSRNNTIKSIADSQYSNTPGPKAEGNLISLNNSQRASPDLMSKAHTTIEPAGLKGQDSHGTASS